METNRFFTLEQEVGERFFRIPKVFFTNEKYKTGLSNDSKIAYAILRDRLELSIKNNWVDNTGNIYFIYTITELEQILNCGNKKINKIKKELEKVNLLFQKRQGLNKPNRLYLLKPEVTKEDIYEIAEENTLKPLGDKDMSKRHVQKCQKDTSRSVEKTRQDMSKRHANDTDVSDTDINNTDINYLHDMYDRVSEKKHTKHTSHNSNTEVDYISEYYLNHKTLETLPKIKMMLSIYKGNDIKLIFDTIWKAVSSFEKECNKLDLEKGYMAIEDVEELVVATLKRFTGVLKVKGESVQNMLGYLMRSIKNALETNRDINTTAVTENNFETDENYLKPINWLKN